MDVEQDRGCDGSRKASYANVDYLLESAIVSLGVVKVCYVERQDVDG